MGERGGKKSLKKESCAGDGRGSAQQLYNVILVQLRIEREEGYTMLVLSLGVDETKAEQGREEKSKTASCWFLFLSSFLQRKHNNIKKRRKTSPLPFFFSILQ